MTNESAKVTGRPLLVGTVALIVGLLVGSVGGHYLAKEGVAPTDKPAKSATIAKATPPQSPPAPANGIDPWDPFQEMRHLQAEMDEMFRRSVDRFHMSPELGIFRDAAGYSLSLDVRELKDRYEVRAFLPDEKTADAKVTLDNNFLRVEVAHRQGGKRSDGSGDALTTEWGRYTQVVELPGKIDASKMNVERKDHNLLITVPKS